MACFTCSAEERALLLSRGLTDRKQPVRECAQQLLCQWLQADAEGSVPALLQLLRAQQHEDAGLQAVSAGAATMISGMQDAIEELHCIRIVLPPASLQCYLRRRPWRCHDKSHGGLVCDECMLPLS